MERWNDGKDERMEGEEVNRYTQEWYPHDVLKERVDLKK